MSSIFVENPGSRWKDLHSGHKLKVGVLTNPLSGANKKGSRKVRQVLSKWPDVKHSEPQSPVEISSVLADFAREGVELIIINGGDGTIQRTLTALGCEAHFKTPPLLSLLCAGTTSMLPRDVGVTGPPATAMERILNWAQSPGSDLEISTRHVLQVDRKAEPPLLGMFFGAGAICRGIKVFHGRDNPKGWRGQLMPTLTMCRLLMAILRRDQDSVSPFVYNVKHDSQPAMERTDLFVLVSTLNRLFLGMRPFWGEEDGPLRFTAVSAENKCLLRVLFSLFFPGKCRLVTHENGYFSHNFHRVELELEGDFTLDGELYDTGHGPLTIQSAGSAMFLCSR